MSHITIPAAVVADNRINKNSLRLLTHLYKLHAEQKEFIVHEALGSLNMTYKAYSRARDGLFNLNYIAPYESDPRRVPWKLSEKAINLME